MDAERSLLSKAIFHGRLDDLVARSIEPEHFADEECSAVYHTMLTHLAKYGVPPTIEAVREAHENFAITVSEEALEYLMDRFLRQVKRREAIKLYREFGDACDDPDRVGEIEVVAMEMAAKLMEILPSPTVGRWSEEDNRIQDYLKRLREGHPPGLLTGFLNVDHDTIGIQDHEFWVVAGWQNSGKSMVMQHIAWNIYEEERKTPLYISLEMSKEECFGRWATMATNIQHRALRALELAEDSNEMQRWKHVAARAKEFRPERDIICIDDIGACTPDRVLVESRRYNPAIVFIDYLELMEPPRASEQQWQGIDAIGRQLKRNTRLNINGRNIPIVVGAQSNAEDGGRGASLDTISYKSTGKHADVVLLIKRTEEMAVEKKMDLSIGKNRNGARGSVDNLTCDPSRMYLGQDSIADDVKARLERQQVRDNPSQVAKERQAEGIAPSPFKGRRDAA